jgi:arylsulfatase A-like enzyme
VPVPNVDFFPTFVAAAGGVIPKVKTIDGEDLRPLMDGSGELKRQSIFWHFPGYLDTPVNRGRSLDVRTGFRSRPVSVIRKGDWKLHLYHEEWQLDGGQEKIDTNQAVELYDLKNDIGERVNLAVANPAKRDELLDDLLDWIKRTNAPMPTTPNPQFDPKGAAKTTVAR